MNIKNFIYNLPLFQFGVILMTRKRQNILSVLKNERLPLGAFQVHDKLNTQTDLATLFILEILSLIFAFFIFIN